MPVELKLPVLLIEGLGGAGSFVGLAVTEVRLDSPVVIPRLDGPVLIKEL